MILAHFCVLFPVTSARSRYAVQSLKELVASQMEAGMSVQTKAMYLGMPVLFTHLGNYLLQVQASNLVI